MAFRKRSGRDTVQLPHAKGAIAVPGPDEKMTQEVPAVRMVILYCPLLAPAGGHLIDSADAFNAKRTGPGGTIADSWQHGRKQARPDWFAHGSSPGPLPARSPAPSSMNVKFDD